MKSVGTRELKQNPNTVIQDVLESGEEYEITAYGTPTGVRLVPSRLTPARWLPGSVLNDLAATAPLSAEEAAAWKADIESADFDDDVVDPWDRQ